MNTLDFSSKLHDGQFVTGGLYACQRCGKMLEVSDWLRACVPVEPLPTPKEALCA